MSPTVAQQPPDASVSVLGGGIPCDGTVYTRTVRVLIDPDAPPGPQNFTLEAIGANGVVCTANGTVTVVERVDLDFAGVSDNDETDPGGFLCLNHDDDNDNGTPDKDDPGPTAGEDDLVSLTVSAEAGLSGTLELSLVSGGSRIKLWQNADRSGSVTLPLSWTLPSPNLPAAFYVEGVDHSASVRDVELRLLYTGGDGPCEDRLKLTVMKIELKALGFDSDHGLMLDNNTDYEPTGTPFPDPEWGPTFTPPRNHPISHTTDLNVGVTLFFWVYPGDAPALDYAITGAAAEAGFNFNATVSMDGGINLPSLTSTDKIEEVIQVLSPEITWTIARQGRVYTRQTTGPHKVYVTMGTPRETVFSEHVVTQKRMERAVTQAGAANSLNPHEIVKTVTWAQGNFALVPPLTNAWTVPDEPAACESIVRFVDKVATMVDVPGTLDRKNIYAIETGPAIAIEVPSTHGGLNTDHREHPQHPTWDLLLIDGGGGCNAFEAVAKLNACDELRYYPGGVTGALMDEKDNVLKVFDSLSWIEWVGDVCTVREEVFEYPDVPQNPAVPSCP